MKFAGTASSGDQLDYTFTFSTGTLTFRARWSGTDLILERVSTIPGTNTGTATLQTFTGSSTNKPRSTGDLVRMFVTVNRGAADSLTAITFGWAGRNGNDPVTTDTFNVDGELTPTAASFAITGSSFQERPNLAGRTADGDGTPAWAIGVWTEVYGFSLDTGDTNSQDNGRNRWGVEADSNARPQIPSFTDNIYALVGTGVGGDQRAHGWFTFTSGTNFSDPFLCVRLTGTDFGLSGYALILVPGSGNVEGDIYKIASGAFTFVNSVVVTGVQDSTPHEWVLDATGETLTVTIDGGAALLTVTDTGTAVLTGDPGLGGLASHYNDPRLACETFQVDDGGSGTPTPNPCVTEIARDDFDVAASDIDTQPLAPPSTGHWEAHPASAGTIRSTGTPVATAVVIGAGRAIYLARSTGVGNDYCVQLAPTFPLNPGSPGTLPWVERWRYRITGNDGNPTSPVSIGIIEGYCDALSTNQYISGTTINDFTMWPSGQPKTFTLGAETATVSVSPGSQAVRTVMFYVRAHVSGGSHTYPSPAVDWSYAINPDFTYLAPDTNGLYNNVGVDFDIDGAENVSAEGGNGIGPTITPSTGTVTWGAADISTANTNPVIHLRFSDFARNDPAHSTGGGISFSGDNATGTITHYWPELMVDGTTSFAAGVAAFDPGGELADASALVRYDAAADSGYRLRLVFDHTGGGIVGDLRLECMDAGTATRMRQWTPTLVHAVEYLPMLRVEGTKLVAVLGGSVMGVFDVATDVADETSAQVTTYATGYPGIALSDASWTGDYMAVDRVVIYNGCTGGPENPYPHDPPPTEPQPVVLWVMKSGQWRDLPAPVAGVQAGTVSVTRSGSRLATDLQVEVSGGWRKLAGDLGQMPPPDTTLPPFFDPCEILDPNVDLPPIGNVDPVPFTGNRFFGAQAFPPTLFDSRFNASQGPAEMPYFMTLLSQAAARSGVIVGAQGGYKKFIVNGAYSQAAMNTFIDSHAAQATAIKAYQDAGTLSCIIIADDFRVARLWPPYGLSDTEITRIAARWNAVIPGIRLALRARPRTFGNPINGVSVYGTQFDGPPQVNKSIGDTVTETDYRNWRNAEGAKVRGWGVSGITMILSPNWLHGGDGESGVQFFTGTMFDGRYMFSAAEWVRAADGWYGDAGGGYDDLVIGQCGYEYMPIMFSNTGLYAGLVDAMVYHRNAMLSIPPL